MKQKLKTTAIRIALFASFLLLSQSVMAEWDIKINWQYPKGGGLGYSIALHPNDSILVVQEENNILFFNTTSGSITRSVPYKQGYLHNITYTKDGRLISSTNKSAEILGIHNAETFEYIFKQNYPNLLNHSYNSDLKMIVGCGASSIKLFDVERKKLVKEYTYQNGLFVNPNSLVTRVTLLNNKSIVYTYSYSENNKNKSRVCIIDSLGKLLLNEESYYTGIDQFLSCLFTVSNDNRTLAYCTADANYIKLIDLLQMKEIAKIHDENGSGYFYLKFTFDDKLLMIGNWNGLNAYNLEKQKSIVIREAGGFHNFQNPKDYYSTLYTGYWDIIYSVNFSGLSGVVKEKTKQIIITPNPTNEKLLLSNPQFQQINTLTAYDILGRTYPLSANGNEVDVSALSVGRYLLKVGLADGSFLDFGFVKE